MIILLPYEREAARSKCRYYLKHGFWKAAFYSSFPGYIFLNVTFYIHLLCEMAVGGLMGDKRLE